MNDFEELKNSNVSGDALLMMDALENSFGLSMPTAGEVRDGEVVATSKNEVLVDIGAKSEAIIRGNEIDDLDDTGKEALTVGKTVRVFVVDPEDSQGNIIVSYTKALEEKDWIEAADLMDKQDVYEGKVIGFNRGGLIVRVGQLRGFIPTSQLSPARNVRNHESTERLLGKAVGETIFAKIIEVNRRRNRLILSERTADRERRANQRETILSTLNEGEVRDGRVVNLADFGAFIDIGGVEGLVHLSELSWKRVNHPSEILNVGDDVKVHILGIDLDRQRVALSLKRLENDPWDEIDSYYQVGQLIEATITKLARYGAFASLNDDYGLEGLIHISELSADHVKHPSDIVEKGQVVATRIIRIDPAQRQIGLSVKQVSSDQFLDVDLAMAEDAFGSQEMEED
ncbi:MAG: S1 RNA-binding domain-containing protein [Anaerolineales bacterium]|nr:S1 RNA-binding domain-containing protein [Anaerolineales bacterium]MCB0019620.1 S1 RNA-binding domain-containing protein [Anaerolineales bacterium]MCB0026826.1 S1 RNA-binding domain-containing protein [Anaerolineales bacterium]